MTKLHEILAVEETLSQAAEKMLSETSEKFNKHTEYFTGQVRTLNRLSETPEDKAMELAARRVKELPTNILSTLSYMLPIFEKSLALKLSKHLTNQVAAADIELDGVTLMSNVPVDFLLDLEKVIPRYRAMFAHMPTLDPSRKWESERDGVWKSVAPETTQGEKLVYPVVLHPPTLQHPAQVKEASKEVVVGIFKQTDFSGAATSQQKADVLSLCDRLLIAVKQARMRANSVELKKSEDPVSLITDLFMQVLVK